LDARFYTNDKAMKRRSDPISNKKIFESVHHVRDGKLGGSLALPC